MGEHKAREAAAEAKHKQQRGELARCQFCGLLYPMADVGGRLVAIQPVMVRALTPISNVVELYGTDGRRRASVAGQEGEMNLGQVLHDSQCREIPALIPHEAVCQVWALARGGPNAPLAVGVNPTTGHIVPTPMVWRGPLTALGEWLQRKGLRLTRRWAR